MCLEGANFLVEEEKIHSKAFSEMIGKIAQTIQEWFGRQYGLGRNVTLIFVFYLRAIFLALRVSSTLLYYEF